MILVWWFIAASRLLVVGDQFGKNGPEVMHQDQVLLAVLIEC